MSPIDVNEFFYVNEAGDTITGTKKSLANYDYIQLPPEITIIQNISNGYPNSWFYSIFTLDAPMVTELGESSLINCRYLRYLKLPSLKVIKSAVFTGTMVINPDFYLNEGLEVYPNAFEFVNLTWIKLPTSYTLQEGAFLNIQTQYTVVSNPTYYTNEANKNKYFMPNAIIETYTTTSQSRQIAQMNNTMTKMDAKINKMTEIQMKMSKKQQLMMKLIKRMVNKNLR